MSSPTGPAGSAKPAVQFNTFSAFIPISKIKKKYDTDTIGPAAARALTAMKTAPKSDPIKNDHLTVPDRAKINSPEPPVKK